MRQRSLDTGSYEPLVGDEGLGGERLFAVPTGCEPSGHALMDAHFKLGRVGMVSPRMHFLDSWSKTGEVYVGYSGAHLTNTQSN